jgi:hypothetical protein
MTSKPTDSEFCDSFKKIADIVNSNGKFNLQKIWKSKRDVEIIISWLESQEETIKSLDPMKSKIIGGESSVDIKSDIVLKKILDRLDLLEKDHELLKKDNELLKKDHELLKKDNELLKKDHELLKKRVSYLEQELFYQKALAISGSTLSEFFRGFSKAINQPLHNQTWENYFSNIKKDENVMKMEKIGFSVNCLKKFSELISKKNKLSHPSFKNEEIEELFQVLLKDGFTKLDFHNSFSSERIELSKDEIKTLLTIIDVCHQVEKLSSSEIGNYLKDQISK